MTWANFRWIWIQPQIQRPLKGGQNWRPNGPGWTSGSPLEHIFIHNTLQNEPRTKKSENIHLTKMIYDELIEMSEPDKRFSLLFTFFIHYVATTFTTLQKRSIFISVGPTTNTPNKNLCSGTWILLTEQK